MPVKTTEEELLKASKKIIKAWDSLEGGMYHSANEFQDWLLKKMAPAMKKLRKTLEKK